jgi:hypothetical protein
VCTGVKQTHRSHALHGPKCYWNNYTFIIIFILLLVLLIIIRVYVAKSCLPIHKHQTTFCHNSFHASASHEVLHLMLPWLLQSSNSPPTMRCPLVNLLQPVTLIHSKEVSKPFHLPFLILSKIMCSACILLLMVVYEIFCNVDTLANFLKYSIFSARSLFVLFS